MMQVGFIDSICLPIYEVRVAHDTDRQIQRVFSFFFFFFYSKHLLAHFRQAFAQLSDKLVPLVDGVRENKRHWLEIGESKCETENCTNHDRTSSASDNEETSEQADQ